MQEARDITIKVEDNNLEGTKEVEISGSFTQSYALETLATYLTKSSMIAYSYPISFEMPKLSNALKGLLYVSPIIPALYTQIPMTLRVHITGAKNEAIALVALTSLGMISLTVLYGLNDISTIEQVDWRYMLILGSGLAIGHGPSISYLITDVMKWLSDTKKISKFQMLNSFLIDTSSISAPIVTYFLGKFGYHIPFSIYTSLTLAGGLLGMSLYQPSPYNQFKRDHTVEEARVLAVQKGQLEELLGHYDNLTVKDLVKKNLKIIWDRRLLLLGFSVFTSLGSFFVVRTILPDVLTNGFGLSNDEAVITSTITSLLTIITRPITSLSINRWFKDSGGVPLHVFGSMLAIAGSTALAVGHLSDLGLYGSLALTYTGFAMTLVTPMSIAEHWCNPNKGDLEAIDLGIEFGQVSTWGSIGGILLPLLISLVVDDVGDNWYNYYFFIIITLMLISAIGVPIVDYQVRERNPDSFFSSPMAFFKKSFTPNYLDSHPKIEEIAEEEKGQDAQDSIMLYPNFI